MVYIIQTTEPILRLRKTSMMRMMRSFDHSGEDNNTRKRQYDEALGNGDETHQQNNTENDELKEGVSKMMDPPARERPAVSIYFCYYMCCLFNISIHIILIITHMIAIILLIHIHLG